VALPAPDRSTEPRRLTEAPNLTDLEIPHVKIYADGADLESIIALAEDPRISGFTTNPTLMRKAGVDNYESFPQGPRDHHPAPDLLRGLRRRARRDGASGPADLLVGRQRLRQDPDHQHPGRSQ